MAQPIVRSLDKVKDAEITLEDVRRAEQIIERANKLLGRKTECHHYHGWSYVYPTCITTTSTPTYYTNTLTENTGTLTLGASGTVSAVNVLSMSVVDAAQLV